MATVRVAPATALSGVIGVPPDKSITHRALMLGGISDRTVTIDRPLDSADTAATLGTMEACRVPARGELGGRVELDGVGLRGLRPPPVIDCLNAGTLIRLVAGILVGQSCDRTVLDGDESLRRRPMNRIARPLAAMGAEIHTMTGGTPPVIVSGPRPLRGMVHELPVASGQVKSCLLLAGLFADGETWVHEPHPSRDHTERMLAAAGIPLLRDGVAVGLRGPVEGIALPDLTVPGDFSSAAFHIVAAALRADPQVRLIGVNLNPTRTGLLAVLDRMGVDVLVQQGGAMAGEPCGDLVISRADGLRGTEVAPDEVPGLIDELPLVGLLGAFASGVTAVRGAQELRVKESDRIAAVCAALRSLGVRADEREDGFTVHGAGRVIGGEVDSAGDHRLAMLGAIAGLASVEGVSVAGFESAAVSYPGFAQDIAALGGVR